jgi:methylthioribulose-1-phosphate dehydratase
MTKTSLKQDLLAVIHWFHAKGWAPATSTNYSFRNPKPGNNTYTISRSGVDKGLFQIADFMEVDAQGNTLEAFKGIKPSAETLLHTMLYEKPEVQAILHTHSVVNTAYSWMHRDKKAVTLEGFELLKGIAGISTHETSIQLPIFENSQDMQALSAEIREGMAKFPGVPGFLLAGHGLYAWGSSIAEAKRHLEVFEFLMECLLLIEKK